MRWRRCEPDTTLPAGCVGMLPGRRLVGWVFKPWMAGWVQTGEHSGLKMALHKANIIDEMEATMPR